MVDKRSIPHMHIGLFLGLAKKPNKKERAFFGFARNKNGNFLSIFKNIFWLCLAKTSEQVCKMCSVCSLFYFNRYLGTNRSNNRRIHTHKRKPNIASELSINYSNYSNAHLLCKQTFHQ